MGLWGSAALAYHAWTLRAEHLLLYAAVPALFLVGHVLRVLLRQSMIVRLLSEHALRLKAAVYADILGSWLWSFLLLSLILSSAFGRTIRWRGILYRLVSPTQTDVIRS